MSRPRLLDLFSGAGGAGVGYHRAGFDVVGVDIQPMPRYPYTHIVADALDVLADQEFLAGFDAVHASPPCQRYSMMSQCRPGLADRYPDLLAATRDVLLRSGLPWVIENVPGAPMRPDLVLCGCQFDGLCGPAGMVLRERWFEFREPLFAMAAPCYHPQPSIPLAGNNPGAWYYRRHGRGVSAKDRGAAMGIDWMNREELADAIPPAYTEHVGGLLLDSLLGLEAG
jgi:DNA (cytosine-5)-methyltransferase 1